MNKRKLPRYSIPHLLHIEMSYSCNSKCFFCYNPYRTSPIQYSKIDAIVNSVAKSKVPHVYLIGGEPSLLKIEKLNSYIKKLSVNSSVTIVTNGLVYMDGLSNDLACLGVAIHGDEKTQEWLSGIKGGYARTVENIQKYVLDGFDVRCIPVLTSKNYDQMYDIIKLAKELGMESVFVDKFEIGGMGLEMANKLKPSLEQFKIALTQMIKARDDFNIPVGFGTAIPYCLDERLINENMFANCGVGVTFAAINPDGDFRICNQSEIVYGNVLKESVEKIWNKKSLDNFRNLEWVQSPCKDCYLVNECTGGCKVDLSCCQGYCVDYHIRENREKLVSIEDVEKLWKKRKSNNKKYSPVKTPTEYREFVLDPYLRLNDNHLEKYVITRYQTVVIDNWSSKIIEEMIKGVVLEEDLVSKFKENIEIKEIRKFLTKLELIEAIHRKTLAAIDWEITRDCNLKCKHCLTSCPQITKYIPLGMIIRSINELCLKGLEEISFTGGEPFMHPHIWEIIEYCKSKGLKVRVLTNGVMLNEENVNRLKGNVEEIGVSLDGMNANTNDFFRGTGNFERVQNSISLLNKNKISFSLYFTLNSKNKDIQAMVDYAKKTGAKYCRINEISLRGRASRNYQVQSTTDSIKELVELDDNGCNLSDDHLFIDPEGNCYACVELSQIGKGLLGNIYEIKIDEILDSLKRFANKNIGKDCAYRVFLGDFETVCLNNNCPCRAV